MIDLTLGVKVYGNEWFLQHRLEPEQAADILAEMGVTFVLSQSRYLPMADSAVRSAVTDDEAARYRRLDDRALREALRDRGIAYCGTLNIGFDPAYNAAHPDDMAIDQAGRKTAKQDWYEGIPPDREANTRHKIGLLKTAVRQLDPDGIHLGFVRWPGFWETWLDDADRRQMADTCYARQTLARFAEATGADIPIGLPQAAATTINASYRDAWRDWKCRRTTDQIGEIRSSVGAVKLGLEISINTLPFFERDFDDAVREVFGQDIGQLASVVDTFEVMAYHQIMRRPLNWPASVAADVKRRAGRRAICTLQLRPLYLEGMHAGRGRSPNLDAHEFSAVVDAVERSSVDGLCVFTFADVLELRGTDDMIGKLDRLRRFRR